jgi:hypothetical protein
VTDWRSIPGFPGYEVSADGQVRSFKTGKARVRHLEKTGRGYVAVGMTREDGRRIKAGLNRIVALVFIGPPPAPGLEVNHKDGNKLNSQVENLEYVTRLENVRHAILNGLTKRPPRGDAAYHVRFSFAQIQEMRRLRDGGWKLKDIAARFGASKGHVSELVRGIHRAAA